MKTVKCPYCNSETKTIDKWVECDLCGNGFKAKLYEVRK